MYGDEQETENSRNVRRIVKKKKKIVKENERAANENGEGN